MLKFKNIHLLSFKNFHLDSAILDGIRSMGYQEPTPIQMEAIPVILAGHDLIACAQTGTGKTAAFVLPILHKINQLPADGINTLIIVPTRELAIQIDQQIDAMSYFVDIHSIAVYGGGSGQNWVQQRKALEKGTDIIIATPGRLKAQIQTGDIDFSKIKHFILDEADRMMDMGFLDDIIQIERALPKERQTLCFSATMPPKIRTLTKKILHNPVKEISIAVSQPAEGIQQLAYAAYDEQKLQFTTDLLKAGDFNSVIIFASSKDKVKQLERQLKKAQIAVHAFHSDLEQSDREIIMQQFKNHHINVLVGTDILSRGIDVTGIDLVINFDVPHDVEDYVHRIGRTARADTSGTAITLVNPKDQRRFADIQRQIVQEINYQDVPAQYGDAPQRNAPKYASNSPKTGSKQKKGKKQFYPKYKGKKKQVKKD